VEIKLLSPVSWIDPGDAASTKLVDQLAHLSKAFYLTAESDVGGFGIGSDIAV
jgi:hypothetical protein